MSLHLSLRAGLLRLKDSIEDRVRLVRWAITAAKKREQLKIALSFSQEALTGLEAAHEIGDELDAARSRGVPESVSTQELYDMATEELRQAEAALREFLEYGEVKGGVDYRRYDAEDLQWPPEVIAECEHQAGEVGFFPGVVPQLDEESRRQAAVADALPIAEFPVQDRVQGVDHLGPGGRLPL